MNETKELFSDKFVITHEVDAAQEGVRLDAFLKQRYRRRSREQIKRAIQGGRIRVTRTQSAHLNVGRLKPSSQLLAGDEVQVLTERKPEPAVNFNYSVLHEDDELLIVNKPPNLPVHPAGAYFFHTLLVHLRTDGFRAPLRAEREYHLAHRIDKETSGVLVLTKDPGICAALTEQFRERRTQKRYLAIVHGSPQEDEFAVDLPVKRDERSAVRLKMRAVEAREFDDHPDSLPASTRVRVLSRHGDFTLVECFPKTGRQHQIRIHLAAVGHPLVGDKLYSVTDREAARFYDQKPTRSGARAGLVREKLALGSGEPQGEELPAGNPSSKSHDSLPPRYISPELQAKLILPRQALHAAGLWFDHPVTGRRLEFHAPLADDLAEFLVRQGAPRRQSVSNSEKIFEIRP